MRIDYIDILKYVVSIPEKYRIMDIDPCIDYINQFASIYRGESYGLRTDSKFTIFDNLDNSVFF